MKKFFMVAIALIACMSSQAQEYVYSEGILSDPLIGTSNIKISGKMVVQDSVIIETVEGITMSWRPASIQKEGTVTVYTHDGLTFSRRLQLAPIDDNTKSMLDALLPKKKKSKSQEGDYTHFLIDVSKDKFTGAISTTYMFLTLQK